MQIVKMHSTVCLFMIMNQHHVDFLIVLILDIAWRSYHKNLGKFKLLITNAPHYVLLLAESREEKECLFEPLLKRVTLEDEIFIA
jgi:hypothetical protein